MLVLKAKLSSIKSPTLRADNGFNAKSGEYEDLVAAGVIDPVKVTKSAINYAASVASLLLNTDAMIAEIKDYSEKPAPPPRR